MTTWRSGDIPSGTKGLEIAITNEVEIRFDVVLLRVKDSTRLAQSNAHASYFSANFHSNERLCFDDLFPAGRVLISMHRCVFLSDESIVAHLTHELSEVEGLRVAFDQAGGWLRARDIHELIRSDKRGNLHDLAWDEANRAVDRMRKRERAPD